MINYIHAFLNLPTPAGVTAVFVRVYYCFGIDPYTPKAPRSLVLLKTDRVSCVCYNPDRTTNAEDRLDSRPFRYAEYEPIRPERPHKPNEIQSQAPFSEIMSLLDIHQLGAAGANS